MSISAGAATVRPSAGRLLVTAALLVAVSGVGYAREAAPERAASGEGTFVLTESWGLPPPPFAPIDVALGPDGTLYLADGRHGEILIYAPGSESPVRWSAPSFWPGYLQTPRSVVLDSARDRVYILWERYLEEDPQCIPTGLFLDERLVDGSAPRSPLAISFAQSATDMALHSPSGDLYIAAEGQIHRVRMPGRVHSGSFPVDGTDGAHGHLAVTPDGRIALPRPDRQGLAIYTIAGQRLDDVALPGFTPVAASSTADGGVCVLVAAQRPAADDPEIVVCLDRQGGLQRIARTTDLGVAPPVASEWPWAVAADGEALAVTTGRARFEVAWLEEGADEPQHLDGAVVRDRFVPCQLAVARSSSLSLAAGPGNRTTLLEPGEARLLEYDAGGTSLVAGGVPDEAIDVAVGADGERFVTTVDGRLLRYAPGDVISPTWQVECQCSLGGRVDANPHAVYVSRPQRHAVGANDTSTGAMLQEIGHPEAVGLWPADVVVDHEGRLYTADLVTAQVQRWSNPGQPDVTWQAGLLAGPRRLASGRLPDGPAVIAAVMADGMVEIHSALDGNLIARFPTELTDGTPFDASDISLDAAGRILLADSRGGWIHVFTPGASLPETPVADPSATPTPSDRSCLVEGDKWAGRGTIVAGEDVSITLSLAAQCPGRTRVVGADIVLIIDQSGSMRGAKLEAARGAARAFSELTDIRYHRLGLASFSSVAVLRVSLTDDVGTVVGAIEDLERDPGGQTNIGAALALAQSDLVDNGRSDALPVLVLLTDGQHNQGDTNPLDVAEAARNAGTQIYTVGLGDDVDEDMLRRVAGRDDRYFGAPTPSELFPIYGQILRLVLDSLAGNLIVDDELADGIELVPGSARPDALVSPGRLRWGRSLLPATGITLTYDVQPQLLGCNPTNRRALAHYTDGDGARRQYEFPVPEVCVITPTPTPTLTPTPEPAAIFLPMTQRAHCVPGTARADAVLVIDTSDSMRGQKLQEAKQAAIAFVGHLVLPLDKAAVIGFDSEPHLATGLTGSRLQLERAIRGLQAGRGTHIDRALRAAVLELVGARRDPRNRAVIILLSDGAHNGPASEVVAEAAAAKGIGATLYCIGLGADADLPLLRQLAGAERTYFAPEPADLAAIYREIAVTIPCP